MYDIVPGALQHLREADILSKAGLAVAAQGQELCRTGAVHSTQRQGARLSGIVEAGNVVPEEETAGIDATKAVEPHTPASRRFLVTIEIREAEAWHFTCTCTPASMIYPYSNLCVHASALLYCWLAHPASFALPPANTAGAPPAMHLDDDAGQRRPAPPQVRVSQPPLYPPAVNTISPLSASSSMPAGPKISTTPAQQAPFNTADSLALLSLGDLRNIAREYEIAANGLSKQELIEAIMGAFRQPEVVRRTVSSLEKTQRQFLATFTLAGGYMNDEELRSLFERFGLGKPDQFQFALAKLQSKGLLLRAGFNTAQQLRTNLGGLNSLNPLEVTWFVPTEVGAALPITLPITPFRVEEQQVSPIVRHAEPYRLLADLLLVARALQGGKVPREEKRAARRGITGSLMRAVAPPEGFATSSSEGSVAIPPPVGLLPADLLEALQEAVPLSASFLRFAYRILRLGEILYTDTEASPTVPLYMLPNAAELLLGPTRGEVTMELFAHWQRQASYIELFELTEVAEGALRLRCRTVAPNQPALRQGELEAENREARQWLLSLLAQAPPHQWISFPAFARFVYRLYPTFLQRRQHLYPVPHWWIEREEGRSLHPTQWNDWLRAEGYYLAQLLYGPLHWWGASDIALSPDGQLLAFRLTALAELLFHGSGSPSSFTRITAMPGSVAADGHGATEVEDDPQRVEGVSEPSHLAPLAEEQAAPGRIDGHLEPIEVAMYDMSGIELSAGTSAMEQGGEGLYAHPEVLIVSSAGNWPLIDLVERFTRVKGVRAGRLRYEITPASLSDALGRGEDPAPFLELLRCALDTQSVEGEGANLSRPPPIAHAASSPAPVEEMLRMLERRMAGYGGIRLYTDVTVLAVADTLTMRELTATTSLERQVIRAIHPTMLVLKRQGGEQVIDELKRRGQAPLVHGDE